MEKNKVEVKVEERMVTISGVVEEMRLKFAGLNDATALDEYRKLQIVSAKHHPVAKCRATADIKLKIVNFLYAPFTEAGRN